MKSLKSHSCGFWLCKKLSAIILASYHRNSVCLKDNAVAALFYTNGREVRIKKWLMNPQSGQIVVR